MRRTLTDAVCVCGDVWTNTGTIQSTPARLRATSRDARVSPMRRMRMRMSDRPEPNIDARGIPYCSDSCRQYDDKRCMLMGARPASICEPAVEEMALRVSELRTLLTRGGR